MILLALDTSTEACSAALIANGTVYSRFELAPRRHNEILLPMIQSLLDEADISLKAIQALALGQGPGSFTGIRIATGTVQGLALGLGCPVIPISTLAALALEGMLETGLNEALPTLDARMDEIYAGHYRRAEDGSLVSLSAETVVRPEHDRRQPTQAAVAIGSGWDRYAEILGPLSGSEVRAVLGGRFPSATLIARLALDSCIRGGAGRDVGLIEPVYLRDQVAQKPKA